MMQQPLSAPAALIDFIRSMMIKKGLNNSSLARQLGVSEGAIRHLLQPTPGKATLGPDPLLLRAMADALDLDQVQVFQLAGYIAEDYAPATLSISAQYVGLCFDGLSPEKQSLLMNLLHTLMGNTSEPQNENRMRFILGQIRQLRREYPLFRQRTFGLRDEFGRFIGSSSRTTTPKVLLHLLYSRLTSLFVQGPEGATITEEYIQQVTNHPDVVFVLEYLLPRKVIPTALEKLYWLIYNAENVDITEAKLKPAEQQAYKALWRLLQRIAEEKTH